MGDYQPYSLTEGGEHSLLATHANQLSFGALEIGASVQLHDCSFEVVSELFLPSCLPPIQLL